MKSSDNERDAYDGPSSLDDSVEIMDTSEAEEVIINN